MEAILRHFRIYVDDVLVLASDITVFGHRPISPELWSPLCLPNHHHHILSLI